MQKKEGFVPLLGLAVFLAPFVSAQSFFGENVTRGVIDNLRQIFGPIFEIILNTSSFDQYFFAKILILLLLFVVILGVTKRVQVFQSNKWTGTVVAAVISIMAVRFMSDNNFIVGILLPYGALGIAITTFLPFLVYFWFVHDSVSGAFARRLAWILYGIVFLLLWGTRPAGQLSSNIQWIYFLGLLAVAISLFFDKSVHGYFITHQIDKFKKKAGDATVARLQSEYVSILNLDTPQARSRRRDIEDHLRRIGGDLP